MTDAPTIYARVRSYEEMVSAIKRRAAEQGLSYADVDHVANLPSGYMGKAAGPSGVRRFGWLSTFAVAWALGLTIAFVEAPTDASAPRNLAGTRKAYAARPNNYSRPLSKRIKQRVARVFGRAGGRASMRKLTPEERRQRARRASMIRWRRVARGRSAARTRWHESRVREATHQAGVDPSG